MGFSILIGVAGGLVATVYYYLLELAMRGVWDRLAHVTLPALPVEPMWRPAILVITVLGGVLVGLLTRWLGSAGEIAAVVDNIHVRDGRIDIRQTPAMTAQSLVSIAAGGSAGPEAPLVQIIGSFASGLGDWLGVDGRVVRTLTFCGMGAALGAFFGAPLGGALFALEIPHRRGIEYYEALLPAVVSAIAAFLVFRSIVGYEHVLFHLDNQVPVLFSHIVYSLLFGAIGAGVAVLFVGLFSLIHRLSKPLERSPVLLASLGGLLIGLLAQISPKTLFWGEYQIDAIIHSPATLLAHHGLTVAVVLLLVMAVVKSLAVGATLHSGFRGGFIFPMFFIGAAVGAAISLLVPSVPAPVIIIAMMAAVNVAVTKTPISTCIILATLTGTSLMPVLICSSLVSLLLTTKLNLIHTQRTRGSNAPGLRVAHS
jgi:H+/Cl- antiporter ClcA